MDAILAQVEPSLLRTHSFNAFQQELSTTKAALAHAAAAAARLRDVHDASRKLSIDWTPSESDALSAHLLEARQLLEALSRSIRHVQAPLATHQVGIKTERQPPAAASVKAHAIQLDSDSDSDAEPTHVAHVGRVYSARSDSETDDEAWPPVTETPPGPTSPPTSRSASKKRKLDARAGDTSTKKASKQAQKASAKDAATATKELLVACTRRMEDLLNQRVNDRRAGLKALVAQFNQFHKHLSEVPRSMEEEASEILFVVVSTAVSVMTKEKLEFKRHWVRQFQSAVSDVRAAFDVFALKIEPTTKALAKFVDNFPLTIKEGQRLRGTLRRTLDEVKSWREGRYTTSDCAEMMNVVKHALDSKCSNWDPWEDKTVCELIEVLLARMAVFSGKKHTRRMKKMSAWLEKIQSAMGRQGAPFWLGQAAPSAPSTAEHAAVPCR